MALLVDEAAVLAALQSGQRVTRPLWPKRYAVDSIECLTAFVLERCITWDDETKLATPVPDIPHVRWLLQRWWVTRDAGQPLIIEKSRRLLVSWLLACAELWSAGVSRETRVIVGLNYAKASEQVWRVAWLYRTYRDTFPGELKADCETRDGNYSAQQINQVILPNGSIFNGLNQESDTFQGSGYSGIRMEEASLYKRPQATYGQARAITKGRSDVIGGHVVVVTNASPSLEWQELKKLKRIEFNHDPSWKPAV